MNQLDPTRTPRYTAGGPSGPAISGAVQAAAPERRSSLVVDLNREVEEAVLLAAEDAREGQRLYCELAPSPLPVRIFSSDLSTLLYRTLRFALGQEESNRFSAVKAIWLKIPRIRSNYALLKIGLSRPGDRLTGPLPPDRDILCTDVPDWLATLERSWKRMGARTRVRLRALGPVQLELTLVFKIEPVELWEHP